MRQSYTYRMLRFIHDWTQNPNFNLTWSQLEASIYYIQVESLNCYVGDNWLVSAMKTAILTVLAIEYYCYTWYTPRNWLYSCIQVWDKKQIVTMHTWPVVFELIKELIRVNKPKLNTQNCITLDQLYSNLLTS